jgi:predicted DNA-binding transcriptional regulator AlpA
MEKQEDVYLTARDVQKRYRITETTLYRHIKSGEIAPPIKIGGMNRWRRADLEAQEEVRHASRRADPKRAAEDWIEDEVKDSPDDESRAAAH